MYRIGNYNPAVKFEVIEKPNDWANEIKKSDASNPTKQKRYEYWVAFQEHAFQKGNFSTNFNRRKPSTDHWMDFTIGSYPISCFTYRIGKNTCFIFCRKRSAIGENVGYFFQTRYSFVVSLGESGRKHSPLLFDVSTRRSKDSK